MYSLVCIAGAAAPAPLKKVDVLIASSNSQQDLALATLIKGKAEGGEVFIKCVGTQSFIFYSEQIVCVTLCCLEHGMVLSPDVVWDLCN